ncbi:MAG: gas vesicle protein [Dehalococcoidales bacterium]|nr:gas vesicle protein [Dehalococcoidales bacterium]
MDTQEVVMRARALMADMGKKSDDGITGLSRTEDGWTVSIEIIERKAIPDTMDILGLYEMRLSNEGDLLSLERKSLRKRGDTGDE